MTETTAAFLFAPSTPEDRSTEFVPVTGGGETSSAAGLLLAAYVLMWACAFGLIWLSLKRLRGVDARLGQLERELAAKETKGPSDV